jgi:hypothetical protein
MANFHIIRNRLERREANGTSLLTAGWTLPKCLVQTDETIADEDTFEPTRRSQLRFQKPTPTIGDTITISVIAPGHLLTRLSKAYCGPALRKQNKTVLPQSAGNGLVIHSHCFEVVQEGLAWIGFDYELLESDLLVEAEEIGISMLVTAPSNPSNS